MKTAIVFASTHGCAETCAGKLAAKLNGEVHRFNLKDKPRMDLASYDRIVIGGSIHAGRIQGTVRRFIDANRDVLLGKKFGLFISCMETGKTRGRNSTPCSRKTSVKRPRLSGCSAAGSISRR